MSIQPVILCGGVGNRLWPLSRIDNPKQFTDNFDGKSLFEITVKRSLKIKTDRELIIVTSKKYEFIVKNILIKLKVKAKILLEPIGKNTTAAIYLSAQNAYENDIILIMPSDHFISNPNEMIEIINNTAMKEIDNCWVVFGIKPIKPSSSFGYIEVVKTDSELKLVKRFVEKPPKNIANKMFVSGNFLWNSGIFLGKVNFIISSIKKHSSEIASNCDKAILHSTKTEDGLVVNFNLNTFEKIPSLSVDYAILEFEKKVKCVELDVGWSDVGTWEGVIDLKQDNLNNSRAIQIDGNNSIITSNERIIATIGVDDLIIVDSKDATLVTKKGRDNDMFMLIDNIKKKYPEYLANRLFENRPWGKFDVLLNAIDCKVKKLTIYPNKRLSLQYHNHRSEHWLVVKGTAYIHLEGIAFEVKKGNSIDIKKGEKHFIANNEDEDLIIIEIQMGDYFGEDDIVRIDDPYNR